MSERSLTIETNEGDDQLNIGIKMIINAFNKQNSTLIAEINRLNDELADSHSKNNELEIRCSTLSKDRKDYEAQISSLSNQNMLLTQSIKELSVENSKLQNIKSSIIATIEKTDQMPRTSSHDGFSPTQMKTNIKFCKPMTSTSYTRNKNASMDNYSQDVTNIPLPKAKTPMRILNTNTSRNSINKQQKNLQSEFSKCNNNFSSSDILMGANIAKNCNNNNFFKNCRKTMSHIEYNVLIEIVRAFNMGKITKEETFNKIVQMLEDKYMDLLNEFKILFFPND